nr:hypothetical protein [Shewanella oneidensis]
MLHFILANNPNSMPKRLILLIALYTLFAIVALLRAVATASFDLFTLGVLPVLVGILTQAPWSSLVLKIYLGLQTLGLSALGITAIIAYQITPQDVKVVIEGHNIPMLPLVLSIIALLLVQYWIAFSRVTHDYLTAKIKA